MHRDLEDACSRIGWDALYERHIQGLRNESNRGERTARSPFPFSDDHQASFSVNVRNGMWQCWHSAPLTGIQGGNYVQFYALMNARVGSDGRPTPDYAGAERMLRVELGLSRPVDPGWLARCRGALAHSNSAGHRAWVGHKPWDPVTLARMEIGWDEERGRLVIPTCDQQGVVQNTRLYRPGVHPKMLWSSTGLGDNYLFPYSARQEQWVVLVEGEPDAITLRCFGYNGCSGTMGSGNPVPPDRWWVGKQVFIWTDTGIPGREAEEKAIRVLTDGAREVRVVEMPTWEGMPEDNADLSDWMMYLLGVGMHPEQVQREITRVLSEARLVTAAGTGYDAPPAHVDFSHALTAANGGRKIAFNTHILGKSPQVFSLATRVNVTCPARGHNYCATCPMNTQWHGDAVVELDPRSPLSLKLIRTPEDRRDMAIVDHMRLPPRCPDPRIVVSQSADMQVAMIGTTLVESEATTASSVDRRRHEAIIIVPPSETLEENKDYAVEGFVYPLPNSQQQVFLLDRFEKQEASYDRFDDTPASRELLSSFAPKGDVISSLLSVAKDTEDAYTHIRGRLDLHAMYRSVWHSVLAFNFGGSVYRRGWLEALVVGDTRCGKSATFKAMSRMYGTGILIDCKMQTAAGMLGAVEQSLVTGERFVIAGLFPQQDGIGPICMDEFSRKTGPRDTSILDMLSSTRAEGMVKITKAAHASFMARVRLICLANPGVGRLMQDMGCFGVEAILRLIDQPEDVARFDLAMCVSQGEVPTDVINTLAEPIEPMWAPDAHRALLSWTWSRKPEQVIWRGGAEQEVISLAMAMCKKYDSMVPIVEPADQRMRVAKLCVSLAAQCYSTDETGELIVVGPEHVYAASIMFTMWYDKPSFGYDMFSKERIENSTLESPKALEALLDRVLQPSPVIYAEKMMRLVEFNERVLATITPMQYMEVRGAMQQLVANRAIRQNRKRIDTWENTPAFVAFLGQYIAARKGAR